MSDTDTFSRRDIATEVHKLAVINKISFLLPNIIIIIIKANRPYQVLPLRVRVNLGAMTMMGYYTFPKAPVLMELHHLQRCSRCILPAE